MAPLLSRTQVVTAVACISGLYVRHLVFWLKSGWVGGSKLVQVQLVGGVLVRPLV